VLVLRKCVSFSLSTWLLLACLVLSLNFPLAQAQTATPQIASTLSLNAPVIDQTRTLNTAEIAALDAKLRAIHQAGRAQIAIVLVPSTGSENTFDAAMRLAEQWKLGTAQQDNGLLIFVAVQDRRVQILTGYGLEAVLPDVITSRIIREEITPSFREGDYAGGLNAAVERIDQILQLDPELAKSQAMQAQDQAHEQAADPFANLLGMGIFLFVIGQFLRSFLGRFIAATVVAGLAFWVGSSVFGLSVLISAMVAVVLFVLLFIGVGTGGSPGSGRRGGFIFTGGGGSGRYRGSGGYSGGGGGFGGGGASGSW